MKVEIVNAQEVIKFQENHRIDYTKFYRKWPEQNSINQQRLNENQFGKIMQIDKGVYDLKLFSPKKFFASFATTFICLKTFVKLGLNQRAGMQGLGKWLWRCLWNQTWIKWNFNGWFIFNWQILVVKVWAMHQSSTNKSAFISCLAFVNESKTLHLQTMFLSIPSIGYYRNCDDICLDLLMRRHVESKVFVTFIRCCIRLHVL